MLDEAKPLYLGASAVYAGDDVNLEACALGRLRHGKAMAEDTPITTYTSRGAIHVSLIGSARPGPLPRDLFFALDFSQALYNRFGSECYLNHRGASSMCGIAGLIDARLAGKPEALARRALAMSDAIRHRGPDGEGCHVEGEAGLAFSHRRLAIVDLSEAGAQPMVSADGRLVICYNGEIYNAEDLRREPSLRAINWRGHSDTEVLLELAAARGVDEMLSSINGMFALAIWDRKERVLHLARDRVGIKPLFVARLPQGIAFASELKALRAHTGFDARIDERSVASFLRLGYVPAPHCIYRDTRKLMPGEHTVINLAGAWRGELPNGSRYWSLRELAGQGRTAHVRMDDEEATVQLERLLQDAVSRQMISDVPLGALLSGGIDSSAVAAMMVAAGKGPVRTFSIGFEEGGFDESRHAAAVARHLGTSHTALCVTAQDALDVIPQLPTIYDEPFADSSQIPTNLVSKLTRQHVTVALSGDGGDELFAGYNRHKYAAGLGAKLSHVPAGVRRAAAWILARVPAGAAAHAANVFPQRLRPAQMADKLRKLAQVLPLSEDAIYLRLVSQNDALHQLIPGLREYPPVDGEGWEDVAQSSLLARMQYFDMMGYLPDDILQKVDRASMAVALEVRPPFLDHRLVEFAWGLRQDQKIRAGETKWILRRVLDKHVPRALIDRPKMGFAIPLSDWLRGPLKPWAQDLIGSAGSTLDGLNSKALVDLWARHQSKRENLAYAIWPILMLVAWRHAYTPHSVSGRS